MPRSPHPDEVVGVLAGILHRLVPPPVENTIPDLPAYERCTLEEMFPAPSRVPVVEVRRRWAVLGLESDDIWFPSLHQPIEPHFARRYRRYRANHTVWGRWIRPYDAAGFAHDAAGFAHDAAGFAHDAAGFAGATLGRSSRERSASSRRTSRPRLVYLHGFMQPETAIEEITLLTTLATRLGVEVIQVQPPYHGRRRPRGSRFDGELYWTADVVRSLEALRQSILDARTVLAWLLDQDDRPVGITGLSLGGALTAALTCLEPRFAFSIPLIGHMDLAAILADVPVLEGVRRELAELGFGPADLGRLFERIGWNELRPPMPRERIHIFAASQDHFFRPERVEAMWRRWGEPRIDWYPCSHMGFIAHLPEVIPRMRELVDEVAGRSG